MTLQFYNSLTRKKETLNPITSGKVGMYVCGPTVYARPHIGNARSVVVYDVLYRLLRHVYGETNVTYVRNITDVDDKINTAAIERGITIQALTAEVTQQFHDDIGALNCLPPNIEPRATEHIAGMIAMIEKLIANGNAYVGSDGKHVLFSVTSHQSPEKNTDNWRPETGDWYYGMLSGRTVEEQQAGARVAVEDYKKHSGDFVLWKPTDDEDDASSVFDSPWGKGRPGWHIECSVMSTHYLGDTFDIHGGGADLKFPHHENEIAQSCCANPYSEFAKLWVHNGFLTVNGEKMSKSLGNFITVKELLDKGIKGEVIRLALLSAKYNEPLDWNDKVVSDASKLLDRMYRTCDSTLVFPTIEKHEDFEVWHERYEKFCALGQWEDSWISQHARNLQQDFISALKNDLNTIEAVSVFIRMMNPTPRGAIGSDADFGVDDPAIFYSLKVVLRQCGRMFGLLQQSPEQWFKGNGDDSAIVQQIETRIAAKKARDFATSDRIRDELKAQGIILEDRPDGTTDWRRG